LKTEGTYVLNATIPFFDEQGLMAKERYFAGLIEVTGD
jgi:hypothetical protein